MRYCFGSFVVALFAAASTSMGGVAAVTTIGDFVWDDLNGNGIQDAGEPGIANVTVEIFDSGGSVGMTQTDGTGHYSFDNLNPFQDYTIMYTLPSGAAFSPIDVGGNDTIDSDADGMGQTAPFNAQPGFDDNIDAGIYYFATIGDLVWEDVDGNGIRDVADMGIAGVTVQLLDSIDSVIGSEVTDADGLYEFGFLAPGDYKVRLVLPAGYTGATVFDFAGDSEFDSNINVGNLTTNTITLISGQDYTTADAGLIAESVIPEPATTAMAVAGVLVVLRRRRRHA